VKDMRFEELIKRKKSIDEAIILFGTTERFEKALVNFYRIMNKMYPEKYTFTTDLETHKEYFLGLTEVPKIIEEAFKPISEMYERSMNLTKIPGFKLQ
jgi:hypothetical protein